jgi:hypothetical protein
MAFAAIFVGINGFFDPRGTTPILTLPDWPGIRGRVLTLEALGFAGEQALRLLCLLVLGLASQQLLSADRLGSWLAGRLPRVGMLLLLGFGALPRLHRDAERLALAWRTREAASHPNQKSSPWRHILFWRALFGLSLESSQDTATSLQARGFGLRLGPPTRYRSPLWRMNDRILAGSALLGLGLLLLTQVTPTSSEVSWIAGGGMSSLLLITAWLPGTKTAGTPS